jgi:3',5'-cyclic AMP phosphodiesterase CpdA
VKTRTITPGFAQAVARVALSMQLLLGQLVLAPAALASAGFVVDPYVQMGPSSPVKGERPKVIVQWGALEKQKPFQVEWRNKGDSQWNPCPSPTRRPVNIENVPHFDLYTAEISGINPGATLQFRLLHGQKSIFEGGCVAPKTDAEQQSFAVFGDTGIGSLAQGAIARQVRHAKPDYAVITGDIVYGRGRVSGYLSNWFPVMNASDLGAISGAPLLSSVLCIAAPGNHDLLYSTDLDAFPDGLGYFIFWSQPLNGPADQGSTRHNVPPLTGSNARQAAFKKASGNNFPRMAQFSFDYGDAHWTILDANPYMDWTSPRLRAWLDKDLAAAKSARWRFVALHQSPFTSSLVHINEQQMRLVADLFEKHKVDLVFSGHSHCYERSYPLRFAVDKSIPIKRTPVCEVKGSFQLDKSFDGKVDGTPDGVIYVVTGAGGARLTLGRQLNRPFTLQPYTQRLIAQPHSFTLCEISGAKLRLRQISDTGRELDTITIDKSAEERTAGD